MQVACYSPSQLHGVLLFEANMKPSDLKCGMILKDKKGFSFEVLSIAGWDSVSCRYVNTGTVFTTQKSNVLRGALKDRMQPDIFGSFIGIGERKENLIYCGVRIYSVWRNMIKRCYDVKNNAYHRYGGKGVAVCKLWMNYQNFAEWFCANYPTDGGKYQIDKDYFGGALYSPETCIFLTQKENILLSNAKTYKITYKNGSSETVTSLSQYAARTGRSQATLSKMSTGKSSGKKSNTDIELIEKIT